MFTRELKTCTSKLDIIVIYISDFNATDVLIGADVRSFKQGAVLPRLILVSNGAPSTKITTLRYSKQRLSRRQHNNHLQCPSLRIYQQHSKIQFLIIVEYLHEVNLELTLLDFSFHSSFIETFSTHCTVTKHRDWYH